MAEDEKEATRHVLYVSGPLRERLYRRFARLFNGRDVEVRLDRRVAERRREQGTPAAGQAATEPPVVERGGPGQAALEERRTADRRTVRPEWMVPPPDEPVAPPTDGA